MSPRLLRYSGFHTLRGILAGCFISIIATGCASLATVRERPASLPQSSRNQDEFALVRKQVSDGAKIGEKEPLAALGYDLAAAERMAAELRKRPNDSAPRQLYNFAVARAAEHIQRAGVTPWHKTIKIPGPDGTYWLSGPAPPDAEHDPSNYTFTAADRLAVSGQLFSTRTVVAGLGAPLVAIGRTEVQDYRARYETKRIYCPVTAVAVFHDHHRAEIRFIDRLSADRVSLDGHSYPLAADFTAPIALAVVRERPYQFARSEFLHPEKYSQEARLIRLQAYDPARTPLLLIHGLESSPTNFAPMINTLLADPEIRRRYQFWVFSYPTGYPYPYSAMQLRRELDGIGRAFPNHKRIVLVGHSLGGMVARLIVTDAGDRIWRAFFGKSPAETSLPANTRKLLKESLVFNHRPEIKRVIFITTPHRGTDIASSWIGQLRASLVKAPMSSTSMRASVFPALEGNAATVRLNRMPTSIDTMTPDDPFLLEVSRLPIAPGIPYHSILADRGRGGGTASSDGVVAYWSSHLDGAASEFIAPANHSAQKNPVAIAELGRILKTSP